MKNLWAPGYYRQGTNTKAKVEKGRNAESKQPALWGCNLCMWTVLSSPIHEFFSVYQGVPACLQLDFCIAWHALHTISLDVTYPNQTHGKMKNSYFLLLFRVYFWGAVDIKMQTSTFYYQEIVTYQVAMALYKTCMLMHASS